EQAMALATYAEKKIILATNIAESSLTIPGIKVVIDSGIQKLAVYSPWNGLKTVQSKPITQSSAIQRAARAARTSDGHCLRLYAEQDFQQREAFTIPEIMRAELADAYLLVKSLDLLPEWLTPPPEAQWEKARHLCNAL